MEKKNELIKCKCCPEHICKEGNCLCVECMKINCSKFNLGNNRLINRAGNIARIDRGNFYCGFPYEHIIEDYQHKKYINKKAICEHPLEPCNDCKVLTEFVKIYNNKI